MPPHGPPAPHLYPPAERLQGLSLLGHTRVAGFFPRLLPDKMRVSVKRRWNVPGFFPPVHGVYLGQVTPQRAPGPHLNSTYGFHITGRLGQCGVTGRFTAILTMKYYITNLGWAENDEIQTICNEKAIISVLC